MSCFGVREDQMYLVEVLIDKLHLTENKRKDIGDQSVEIKIKFLDLPVFEIKREDFEGPKTMNQFSESDKDCIVFSIGRSCLFVQRPKELVQELRSTPVKVGVFCVGDTYPIAETTVILAGCLCDQIAMTKNDPDNMPKPFSIKGGFHLLDPGENPSGTLDMELKLTCFGRSITTRYELRPRFLLFKKQSDMRDYCVERNIPPHDRASFYGDIDKLVDGSFGYRMDEKQQLAASNVTLVASTEKVKGRRKKEAKGKRVKKQKLARE